MRCTSPMDGSGFGKDRGARRIVAKSRLAEKPGAMLILIADSEE